MQPKQNIVGEDFVIFLSKVGQNLNGPFQVKLQVMAAGQQLSHGLGQAGSEIVWQVAHD